MSVGDDKVAVGETDDVGVYIACLYTNLPDEEVAPHPVPSRSSYKKQSLKVRITVKKTLLETTDSGRRALGPVLAIHSSAIKRAFPFAEDDIDSVPRGVHLRD